MPLTVQMMTAVPQGKFETNADVEDHCHGFCSQLPVHLMFGSIGPSSRHQSDPANVLGQQRVRAAIPQIPQAPDAVLCDHVQDPAKQTPVK